MPMSLTQLRTFVEVYRCRSLSEAARALGLTQPAVSQHVASLEAQLGRRLFERSVRGVAPTAVADDLAAGLGRSLDQAVAALAEARARSARLSGVVHIAAPADLMAEGIAPLLSPLIAAGLDLRLHVGGRDDLYGWLRDGQADLAVTASRPTDPRLDCQEVGGEMLLAVAAPGLAERAAVGAGPGALPHVAYDLDRPLVRAWLDANGLPPLSVLPVATAPDLRVLRALIRCGVGWSVLPDYLCRDDLAAGQMVELPAPVRRPRNAFFLVWPQAALRHPRLAFARQELLRILPGRFAA